ncbi:MAG: hypothetical protein QOG10_783 [Kribbellaceae bacterium]|nr:hypothetical protein [Kribbellaceae bacterium]
MPEDAPRPELKACHAFLDPGDTLVVPSLDRYGRSLQDLINMVAELRERGIGFTSLHENLDTTTPAAGSAGARASPPRKSSAPRAIYCPTPAARSPRSPSCWASPPGTLYNHIPDLRELRAGAVPRQLEAPTR